MPELLFELGCEELPADSIFDAGEQLERAILKALDELGLKHGASARYSTPRRLIVSVRDVAGVQADKTDRRRGPSEGAAFDDQGNATKALEGFCRGQGVDVERAFVEDGYVYVDVEVPGKQTGELLADVLPKAVGEVRFPKTMRWGTGRMRFARPIRWILASFGGKAVDFELAGVKAGLKSRGHRFYAPEEFRATSLDKLLAGLRKRSVEPDPAIREKRIREGVSAVSGGRARIDEALVAENVNLTEWPDALIGEFPQEYLKLPAPVLVTAMAKHERFFPVEGEALENRFVSIRNAGEEDTVREGNQWVLNARFNDAMFFFEEDAGRTLEQFLADTEGMHFQRDLGTVRQRAERLESLVPAVANAFGFEVELNESRLAGLLAKADLSTGLVSELASLQGIIGGEYARRDGLAENVCEAISTQYDIKRAEGLGLALLAADQVDKLVGFLGVGQLPTGSADPYGLRRAASLIVEAAWKSDARIDIAALGESSADLYAAQGLNIGEWRSALQELLRNRYDVLLGETRYDVRDAALLPDSLFQPSLARTRCEAMEALASDAEFVQSATRPINIVASAFEKGEAVPEDEVALADPQGFEVDSPEGDVLAEAVADATGPVRTALDAGDSKALCDTLRPLQGPIDAFFDSTMVMVEHAGLRAQRLGLLNATRNLLLQAGDFSKIVVE